MNTPLTINFWKNLELEKKNEKKKKNQQQMENFCRIRE